VTALAPVWHAHAMQFSLFGAAAELATLDDLAGVVLAGGQWVRAAGQPGARLSVVVGEPWRADALSSAFVALELGGEIAEVDGWISVRTDFTDRLLESALRWTRGASTRVPDGFTLTGGGLRLWAVSAGRADGGGYLLATADPSDPIHKAAGAQLARMNLAATAVTVRGGTGWRVTSGKRLRRLAELLGEPPIGSGDDWPSARAGGSQT
jgi:hypothetical protein